jgi:starch-binding outer membrane protein SusE/F
MKRLFNKLFITSLACCFLVACKKDEVKTLMKAGTSPDITLSSADVTITSTNLKDTVETISWKKSDFGFSAVVNYTLEVVKSGSSFNKPSSANLGTKTQLKYLGSVLNDLAIGLGISPGSTGDLSLRVKSSLNDSVKVYSQPVNLKVTTYQVAYPALLVRGGNGWVTPATRTNGFLLASPNFNTQFEGYVYFPNADGWGGDAMKLESTSSGLVYGWGTSSTTMSVGGGNLWITPAPNYMKVNADINALTISYTPVQFYVSGDNNGFSTSATPMTYNQTTKQWVADNVTFKAGDKFAFTANNGWNISYKVDANGKLIFAGPPTWAGNNIPAPGAGTYTITLDLSGGNGNYLYKIQ